MARHRFLLLCLQVLIVSLALNDLLFTRDLARTAGIDIVENNPLAVWLFQRFGVAGILGLKSVTVTLFSVLSWVIASHPEKPERAPVLMGVGCVLHLVAVAGHGWMFLWLGGNP
jgi:hypothetical protein